MAGLGSAIHDFADRRREDVDERAGGVRARSYPGAHSGGPTTGKGVRLGRKPKLTAHQQQEARRRRNSGRETLADTARSYNVSHSTISRLRCL